MANRTLADEIIAIIRDEANNNPAPTIGVVTKIYTDDYVDVTTSTGDYRHVKIIGDKVIGNEGILVFIDGELDNQYFLSSTEVTSITIDDSLSNISTNPVQNKVINTALGNKVDKETGKGLFSGDYNDLTNKPSIPSDLSDLTDNTNIIPVDVSDLTDDYNTQFTPKTHTHSEYVNPTIADNLTTDDSTQVLSAKQGKVLNDLIGQAITYINQ